MRSRHACLVCAVAFAALALSGCSQVKTTLDSKLAPKPLPPVTIPATVAVPGALVKGKVQSSFPASTPVWPAARVKTSKTTKTPQGNSYTLILKTGDPYADVLVGIGAGLKTAGWKASVTDASSENASASILMISNARNEGIITITENSDATTRIEYDITPKKKKK